MLYRPVSTSHGGKTSGGRAAVATADAMEVEERECQWGYSGGSVGVDVDDAQRVRDNECRAKFSRAEVGGVTSGDYAKAFIVGRIGHRRLFLGSLAWLDDRLAWVCWVCDFASDHMFSSCLPPRAKKERSDAVVSSLLPMPASFSSHFGRLTHFAASHATIE